MSMTCSTCGEVFTGVANFDAHVKDLDDGRATCVPPGSLTDKEGQPLLRQREDGKWTSAKEAPKWWLKARTNKTKKIRRRMERSKR